MTIIAIAVRGLIVASIIGLIICWKQLLSSFSTPHERRTLALGTSTVIGLLPLVFYVLERSHGGPSFIEIRVYGIGFMLFLSLVGCPSAIALYFPGPKKSYFFLFCASTLGVTFGTVLTALASMGLAA